MTVAADGRSVDTGEARRFAAQAEVWWDAEGPFRPLHKLNPARLDFIRRVLLRRFSRDATGLRPFSGLDVLDLGSGGGLVAEPLARLGAAVTGADVAEETVAAARLHAQQMGLDIRYRCATAEDLAAEGCDFDAVLALEVLEHCADVEAFLGACRSLVRPGGAFIFSTLNRTAKSFLLGILAAEHVLRWVPQGTHDWNRFLTPDETRALLAAAGFRCAGMEGLVYDLCADRWRPGRDLSVNYIGWAEPSSGLDGGAGGD
ncbi:MAG: bifunctional 2-polyprenyl-6-hydroxyphenol methylase/3-demethylubiquinol 3-O-methyltransferase UbiG [Rhodothalassiaceae bacterium]